LHFDVTTAVEPLDRDSGWEADDELPDTYPFGVWSQASVERRRSSVDRRGARHAL